MWPGDYNERPRSKSFDIKSDRILEDYNNE